jgi:hypothetical protein
MPGKELKNIMDEDRILNKIYVIRGQKVMLDRDLAELYGVDTKVFNQSVKRNIERFPKDFMFSLTAKEWTNLRSQFVTSSWGGSRYAPKVFTEQGVAMLSSVLHSSIAIQVNIRIIRVFTRLKEFAMTNKDILLKLLQLEKDVHANSKDIESVFTVLKELLEKDSIPQKGRRRIGFRRSNESD